MLPPHGAWVIEAGSAQLTSTLRVEVCQGLVLHDKLSLLARIVIIKPHIIKSSDSDVRPKAKYELCSLCKLLIKSLGNFILFDRSF